ncbi:metal-binding protein ZinT [uncultured Agrobacterium sp.]|uniref:metal-binding protein ZinT n=2 Tax=uncultured Agrobacterium sp. TaxID=157277 RepID=UPI0025E5D48E|nr:metal-binding protein ZinT [uncultured Agrobacterium sp.]
MKLTQALALSVSSLLLLSAAAVAQEKSAPSKSETHNHAHNHSHGHSHGSSDVYKGYFEDSAVKERPLSDWEGDWQSVYPYLVDGTLDPVMQHKAEHGKKSAKEFREEYDVGYKTDVNRITIKGEDVTFYRDGKATEGKYASDGYEILTYKKGNRGVRYIFKKTGGDAAAPQYIQFSDHTIAPQKAGHYHLYWGDDRATVLKELTNWPTYYPSSLSGKEIVQEMLEH